MPDHLEYSEHARRQMDARGFTEADVEAAFRNVYMFDCKPDYSVNIYGKSINGHLRITWIPELRYIVTVAQRNQLTIRDQLEFKHRGRTA